MMTIRLVSAGSSMRHAGLLPYFSTLLTVLPNPSLRPQRIETMQTAYGCG